MRTRKQRKILKGKEEIRGLIEDTGMKYALINNDIFDQFYMNVTSEEGNQKLTELDLIVFIFLQFMSLNKFTLNYEEISKYIGCSSKQLREVLKKLQQFKGTCNAKYYPYDDKMILKEDPLKEESLITEKLHTAYNPKTRKSKSTLHWYINFIPNYKKVKKDNGEKLVPENFFVVTIYDFDLLTKGILTRNEFVTYLFFLRVYNFLASNDNQMWWKLSTIAKLLRYKLVQTVHKHIHKLLDTKIDNVPLLVDEKPKNYDRQIENGEEPSSKYIPVYNPFKLREMNFGNLEVSLEDKEVNKEEMETNSKNEEVKPRNMEEAVAKIEADIKKRYPDYEDAELIF